MAEDWRLTVRLAADTGHPLAETLHELDLEHSVRRRLGERIAVSAAPDHLLLYADTRAAAEQAQALVAEQLGLRGESASFELERWHPLAEDWEPADAPLPATEEEERRERERLDAQDAADSSSSGYAEWEVRLDLASHRDAVALAQRLAAEGFRTTRRWRYLLVGAESRDAAQALADRLRAEAPTGARLQVQPGGEMVWEAAPERPLALFFLPS